MDHRHVHKEPAAVPGGEMRQIPDTRALAFPDRPYSAYCTVCWQAVYGLWVDKEWHGGDCPFGARRIEDCDQAMDMERVKGEIRKYMREQL